MTIVFEAKALQFSNHNSSILCHSVLKFLAKSEKKRPNIHGLHKIAGEPSGCLRGCQHGDSKRPERRLVRLVELLGVIGVVGLYAWCVLRATNRHDRFVTVNLCDSNQCRYCQDTKVLEVWLKLCIDGHIPF